MHCFQDKFEHYNLVPPEVSDQLNMTTNDDKEKKIVDELVAQYPAAFSTNDKGAIFRQNFSAFGPWVYWRYNVFFRIENWEYVSKFV